MINIGDVVSHNEFPPIDGVVYAIQERKNYEDLVGVLRSDTGTIYWDTKSTWEIACNTTDDTNTDSVIDAEFISVNCD